LGNWGENPHTQEGKQERTHEKYWEYAKDIYTCFVEDDLLGEKLWGVLRDFGVYGRLLLAIKSLYS